MNHKWAYVSAAAVLGAAALVVAPFAGRSPAQSSLPIYSTRGVAKGADVTFALRPNIFDPLLEVAAGYATTTMSSSGGGSADSLGSSVYPGSLVIGARGCNGMPGTAQAAFPENRKCATKRPHDESTLIPISDKQSPLGIDTAIQNATARYGLSHGAATVNKVFFTPSSAVSITVASIKVSSDAAITPQGIRQVTVSTVSGLRISIPSLTIDIPTMVSKADSLSDGDVGTADATLTFGDVTATIDGVRHRAYIDNRGVHIGELPKPSTPPQVPLSDDVRQPLSTRTHQLLGQADIDIRAGGPVQLEDGARAESSVGGLVISFESGRPAYPPFPPPPTPIPQVDNHCFDESNPVPTPLPSPFPSTNPLAGFCLGQGVLPIPPGNAATNLSIGGADSLAVASHGFQFNPGGGIKVPNFPGGGGLPGGFPGGLPGTGGGGTIGGGAPGGAQGAPGTTGQSQPPAQLFGLVASMPSGALVGSGLFFIILALGLAWAPSLRS